MSDDTRSAQDSPAVGLPLDVRVGRMWCIATDAERERCVAIIEAYRVPVGNSRAGELAAEWTLDALREVRDEIRKTPNVKLSGRTRSA